MIYNRTTKTPRQEVNCDRRECLWCEAREAPLGKPNAKTDKLGKPKGNQLKINVAAKPRGGRATDHMVKFLTKEFGVKICDIEVVFGRMNVNKQIRVSNPTKLPSVIPPANGAYKW